VLLFFNIRRGEHYLLLRKITARTTTIRMSRTPSEEPTAIPTLPPPPILSINVKNGRG
jgi:hypothetical protein